MLVTKIFEHGDMLDLKLWYCGYYVIDDGTHEVVRWKKRPLFR
jgi:hypothetical protein